MANLKLGQIVASKKIDTYLRSYSGQILSPIRNCKMYRYGSLININPSATLHEKFS